MELDDSYRPRSSETGIAMFELAILLATFAASITAVLTFIYPAMSDMDQRSHAENAIASTVFERPLLGSERVTGERVLLDPADQRRVLEPIARRVAQLGDQSACAAALVVQRGQTDISQVRATASVLAVRDNQGEVEPGGECLPVGSNLIDMVPEHVLREALLLAEKDFVFRDRSALVLLLAQGAATDVSTYPESTPYGLNLAAFNLDPLAVPNISGGSSSSSSGGGCQRPTADACPRPQGWLRAHNPQLGDNADLSAAAFCCASAFNALPSQDLRSLAANCCQVCVFDASGSLVQNPNSMTPCPAACQNIPACLDP